MGDGLVDILPALKKKPPITGEIWFILKVWLLQQKKKIVNIIKN